MHLGLSKLQYAMQVFPELPEAPPLPPLLDPARLSNRMKLATEHKDFNRHADIVRITSIPCYRGMDDIEREIFNRRHLLGSAYESGFRFLERQAEAISAYEVLNGVFCAIGVGQGKCVKGDVAFLDLKTGRRTAAECGHTTTPTMDDSTGKITDAEADVFPSGHKLCIELHLNSGQHVGISEDHPVFTHRGWITAAELQDTDLIAIPRNLPKMTDAIDVSDDVVVFISQMLANGSTRKGACVLCDESGPLVDEFVAVVKRLGGETTVQQSRSKAKDVLIRGLRPLCREWALDNVLSKHKNVPASFWLLPDHQVALFLNRFIAADGHISKNSIECILVSEPLIKDLQFLFLRLGIYARYAYKKTSYVKDGSRHEFDAWRLTITGKSELSTFIAAVGVPLGCDKAFETLRAGILGIKENTNVDVVPIGPGELNEIGDELGYPTRGCSPEKRRGRPRTELKKRFGATSGQRIGYKAFNSWVKDSGYAGKYAWLATGDLRWERIYKIERTGNHQVYDLSVPGTHSWIGNGIVLHNTLTCQTIASIAYSKGIHKIVMFIPPSVVYQFMHTDMRTARIRINVNYPVHCLAGMSDSMRLALARSGKKGLYVFPYSLLSGKSAFDILEAIAPGLILADEAHRLANFTAARSRRVREFVERFNPQMVALSGTITKKTIMEYHHIQKWCLDDKSPLPLSTTLAHDWATIIDAEAGKMGAPSTSSTGPLLPVIEWGQQNFPELQITPDLAGFRRAFKARFTSAPGVVATSDSGIGTSLLIQNNPIENYKQSNGWGQLEILAKKIEEEWLTPNDDVIDHQIHLWKWLYEIRGAGFYNELIWPTVDALANSRKISRGEAEELLEKAKLHHKAGQEYMGAPEAGLRWWLQNKSRPGIDTPMLVGNDMRINKSRHVGDTLYALWRTWKSLDFEGRPEREGRAVRVCDFKIEAAVKWAMALPKGKGALLWVYHQEVGEWLYEYLKNAGADVLHCPAGARHNQSILDTGNEGKLIVASIKAHGEGKNLQAFQEQYFVQWPRPCGDAEQTLGRTHRTGQKADELIVNLNLTSEFDYMVFAATLNDALYVHQTTGNRQKLIYASYGDPRPKIFPSSVLRERGFENYMLSKENEKILAEKFNE